jgi:ornithine carbamoyltransferase
MKRDLISIDDLSTDEVLALLDRAAAMKRSRRSPALLRGRILALVFEKPSLRTRLSFEVAMLQLGGTARFLGPAEVGMGKRESVGDVARTLGAYVDAVAARVFAHSVVEELARHCPVPVVNALSDDEHPCQILADLLTLQERFGRLRGLTVAYVGDSNNVAHSLLAICPRLGINLVLASPAAYGPRDAALAQAIDRAESSQSLVEVCEDPPAAVRDAHAIYADSWYSMGQEHEAAGRRDAFRGYQVNQTLLSVAPAHAMVMHCLPAHRGDEITDEVIDGERSIVFEQAANRLHVQKALLTWLLTDAAADRPRRRPGPAPTGRSTTTVQLARGH